MLSKTIAALSRRAPLLLALGVLVGLAAPGLAELARPLLAPSVWILLSLSALRVDPGRSIAHLRRPVAFLGTLAWMLLITPILCALLLQLFPGLSEGLLTGLVLMAGAAPLMSTPSLAQILGLDDALAMLVMMAATILCPFTLPLIALHVLGLDLGIDAVAWSLHLTLFTGSALAVAFLARWILKAERIDAAKAPLDLAIVTLLIVFAIAIMDGIALRLVQETLYIVSVIGIAFLAYLCLILSGWAAGSTFGKGVGRSVGFITANRNVGIILAVLPAGAHPDIVLYFAIWQMPMYIMPALLGPVYRRV